MSSACRVAPRGGRGRRGRRASAETAVAARVPSSRSVDRQVEGLADEVLVGQRHSSTGQPVATSSPSRRVSSSECQVFLPKSCAGSITIPSGRRRRRAPARRARARGRATSATTSREVDPVRAGPRRQAHRRASRPARRRTRRPRRRAAGSAPPQVSLSRSAPASQTAPADRCPPGVHADHQVRDRRRGPTATNVTTRRISSATVDLGARACLDPADVDDVGALGDRARRPRSRAAPSA